MIEERTIWIKGERNRMHAPITELLLELVACLFDTRTSSLDVVYRDADMAKAATRVRVSIGHFEVCLKESID